MLAACWPRRLAASDAKLVSRLALRAASCLASSSILPRLADDDDDEPLARQLWLGLKALASNELLSALW